RVIAHQVSTRDSFFHQLWTFTRVSPNQKKCRFRTVPVQQIEQFRSHRRIRPIVKGERQLARGVCAANCTPEELRARMCGAVGGGSSYCRDSTWHSDEQPIHAAFLLQESLRSALCNSSFGRLYRELGH